MTPTADRNRRIGGCGTRVIDLACPWGRVLYCYFSAPGVLHASSIQWTPHAVELVLVKLITAVYKVNRQDKLVLV